MTITEVTPSVEPACDSLEHSIIFSVEGATIEMDVPFGFWGDGGGILCPATPNWTPVELSLPTFSDSCSAVQLSGAIVSSSNPALSLPLDVSSGDVPIPVGLHSIEWIAVDDWGNETHASQQVTVVSPLHAISKFDIRDNASVRELDGALGLITSSSDVELGANARVGGIGALGNVSLRSNSLVQNDVWYGQNIQTQHGASILGNSYLGTGIGDTSYGDLSHLVVGSSSSYRDVQPDQFDSATPGTYDRLAVKSRATLQLGAGTYYVRSLVLERNATLEVASGVVIVVRGELIIRGSIADAISIAYLGQNQVSVEEPFLGSLLAPNATVKLSANFRGYVLRKFILLEPYRVLTCDTSMPLSEEFVP